MTCPKVTQLGGGAWASSISYYPVFGNPDICISLLHGFYFESQTPECSAVWVLQATESRRVEVSPTEALAGVEGPRG